MDTSKFILGSVVGGVVYFLLGWLVWGTLLANTFALAPEVQAVVGKEMSILPMFVSCLTWGTLLSYIFSRWAGISTFMSGAVAGAIIGGLAAISFDLSMYSQFNLMPFNNIFIDVIASVVVNALVGGVIGFILSGSKKDA